MKSSLAMALILLALATAAPAQAQSDFPSRPITIVVPFPPGGSSDTVTRLVAAKLADNLKVGVVIDNRGGGGGVPAAIAARGAAPDGYTLFLSNNGLFAILPAMTAGGVGFDPVKDFQTITPLFSFPSVLVVPTGSPAKSVKDLVEMAKGKPGGLNFGSQGVGSGGHILGEMLRLNSGAPFTHVPYRGAGPAVTDLAAGSIDLLFSSYVSAIGQVQGGKLRILGWTAPKRSPALPDVPTMAEAGFPGVELEVWQGIIAPLGTPAPILRKLNEEFIKAAKSPEVVAKVAAQAVEMTTSTPEDFTKLVAADVARLGKVVRDAGIKAQ
jgi:tripartite-type tricarboxylate transporter receptor subunit TctC